MDYRFLKWKGFMKTILISIFIGCISTATLAGGFADCYEKAFQTLNNMDSVKVCVGADAGFKDCYEKAFQTLNNVDSVKACTGAGSDFKDCYEKAFQTLNNKDSIKMCAIKTCR
jgi:hypothetical protein